MSVDHEEVKIIVLGESGVGKTCLINRFIVGPGDVARKESFTRNSHYDPDVKVKEVQFGSSTVKAYLHDSPRREQSFNSHSVAPNFYRNADAVILVYSVDDHNTLDALQDCWITEYATYEDVSATSWIILGNKNDQPLEIDQKLLENFRTRLGDVTCMFVSAKTGNNVQDAFHIAVKKGRERRKLKEGAINLTDVKNSIHDNKRRGGGCC
jgi:GTPase SAR1 family protein